MTNVQFIIQYLSEYPGSRYTDITKALCAWKGKYWTRGTYVRYFSTSWVIRGTVYPDNLWYKSQMDGKWYLTPCGRNRVEGSGLENIWQVRF